MSILNYIQEFKSKINTLFSNPAVTLLILTFIIISRSIEQIYFFNSRSDMTYQILGAQQYLEGHGISFATISANDLSHVNFLPLNKWPPGFSILFAFIYLLTAKNYMYAAILLGIVCSILLIFLTRAILRLLNVPLYLINIFTLLTGFWGYYFYTKPCTDAIGISFFFIALYFSIRILTNTGNLVLNNIFLILGLITCGFIKYLYTPIVFIIPIFLFYTGLKRKNNNVQRSGIYSFLVLAIIFGTNFLIQKTETGSVAYLQSQARGFYPENIKSIFPFITGSIIKPETAQQALNFVGINSNTLYTFFQFVSVLVFIAICIYFIIFLIKKRNSSLSDFNQISFLISFALISILVYLSLTVGKEVYDTYKWTYVQEARYYGIVVILIQLTLFLTYNQFSKLRIKKGALLLSILILLMTPDTIRGVAFTTNRITNIKRETYGWQYELAFQKKSDTIINNLRTKNNTKNIVVVGSSDWMTLRVALYSKVPIFEDAKQIKSPDSLKTTKPLTLLAIIRDADIPLYSNFINAASIKTEGAAYGFHYYSYYLRP